MIRGHLADDRLIDLCLGAPLAAPDRDHLADCPPCEARRLTIARVLRETSTAATVEADAAFPADRLARQQARILQRIDQDGRPGRVIAFPAGHPQEPALPRRALGSSRWVTAAAAAAGLAIGLLAGQLTDVPARSLAPETTSTSASGALRPAVLSDDEFLGAIELAVGSATPAVLNPLDALTPGAADLGR